MTFDFTAKLWEYTGKGAWHFITVPKDISQDITELSSGRTNGFGSVKVEVTLGGSVWKTSIFPDSKDKTFFLPVKAEIRKRESISDGDSVKLSINLLLDT